MEDIFAPFLNNSLPEEESKGPKSYSIKELNGVIKGAVDSVFPHMIWVHGEIQDLKISAKRNIYFNLVEKNKKGSDIAAQIQGFIFDNIRPKIEKRLNTTDISSALKKDIEVKLLCKVQFYQKSARCSLTVYDIDPSFTLGQLALNKERIIKLLQKEGLLNKNKTCHLPLVPLNIGLVTSHNTAAFHDFTDELKRSGFSFNVHVFDAHMQGANVEKDIVNALKIYNSMSSEKLDAIVITRGGGSTADLSFFDSEKIAREVANSKFPVLSAIGHQINTSVLELTSHEQFKTPTKVAQFLISRIEDFSRRVEECENVVVDKSVKILEASNKNLQFNAVTLSKLTAEYFLHHKQDLLQKTEIIKNKSLMLLSEQKTGLKNMRMQVSSESVHLISKKRVGLEGIEKAVKLLDPVNVLKRGFSITLKGTKPLKDAADVDKDDIIHTVFYSGSVDSIVVGDEMQTHPAVSAARQVDYMPKTTRPTIKKPKKKNEPDQLDLFDIS